MQRNIRVEPSADLINFITSFVKEVDPEKAFILNCIKGRLIDENHLQHTHVDTLHMNIDYPVIEKRNLDKKSNTYHRGITIHAQPIPEEFFDQLNKMTDTYNFMLVLLPIYWNFTESSTEFYIIEKLLDHLAEDGNLVLITQDHFLKSMNKSYEKFREKINQNYQVKMVAQLSDKHLLDTKKQLYCTVISKEESVAGVTFLKNYTSNEEVIRQFFTPSENYVTDREKLTNSWDPGFYEKSFIELDESLQSKTYLSLAELARVKRGVLPTAYDLKSDGEYRVMDWSYMLGEAKKSKAYVDQVKSDHLLLGAGDILMAGALSRKSVEKRLYIVKQEDLPAIAFSNLIVIRPQDDGYLTTYLRTEEGKTTFLKQLSRLLQEKKTSHPSLKEIKQIKIPLIPIKEINQLTDEYILNQESEEELTGLRHELELARKDLHHQIQMNESKSEQIENLNAQVRFMNNRFDAIDAQLTKIDEKLDVILEEVKKLEQEFKVIKSLQMDETEMVTFLGQKIDETMGKIIDQGFEMYVEMVKLWIDPNWNKLENLSKKFLPSAELLYSQINKIENSDPSPYIIQYCRALEHELLEKVFRPYLRDLQKRNIEIKETFASDLETNENGRPKNKNRNSFDFARSLLRLENKEESQWFFELGRMAFVLQKLTGSKVDRSPLLSDFKDFILHNFSEDFIDRQFYENISKLTREYRNRAAHPNVIDKVEAEYGKEKIKNVLKKTLDMYK